MSSNKVGFVSLGCPKALVDSERILTQLKIDGYEIVPSYEDAEIVVVNTCGFIDSAKQESLDAIGPCKLIGIFCGADTINDLAESRVIISVSERPRAIRQYPYISTTITVMVVIHPPSVLADQLRAIKVFRKPILTIIIIHEHLRNASQANRVNQKTCGHAIGIANQTFTHRIVAKTHHARGRGYADQLVFRVEIVTCFPARPGSSEKVTIAIIGIAYLAGRDQLIRVIVFVSSASPGASKTLKANASKNPSSSTPSMSASGATNTSQPGGP